MKDSLDILPGSAATAKDSAAEPPSSSRDALLHPTSHRPLAGWRRADGLPSLPESFRTVPIEHAAPWWRKIIGNREMLYIAIGIFGAMVRPHYLYLHSSIVQTRAFGREDENKGDR